MSAVVPTPDGLREILVTILTGAAGGLEDRWRDAIGEVEKLPVGTNVLSNWRVTPTGSEDEVDVIAQAVELVRASYPYVARP